MQSNDNVEIFRYDINETEYKMFDWKDYRVGYFISKNRHKSTFNEDSLFLFAKDDSLLIGVADGAGGHPRGKDASLIAVNEIFSVFQNTTVQQTNIIDIIENINDKVLDLKVGARTTLALTTIVDDNVRSYCVGDSEIIYWNGHGNELYSNIPHSEVGYRIEAGVLPQEESLDDPARSYVDNLIGDTSLRIEVASKMKIKKGHTILIGSDGLFDNLSHDQLTELVGKGAFDKSFEELCHLCIQQNVETWKKDDDISIVLLRKIKANIP